MQQEIFRPSVLFCLNEWPETSRLLGCDSKVWFQTSQLSWQNMFLQYGNIIRQLFPFNNYTSSLWSKISSVFFCFSRKDKMTREFSTHSIRFLLFRNKCILYWKALFPASLIRSTVLLFSVVLGLSRLVLLSAPRRFLDLLSRFVWMNGLRPRDYLVVTAKPDFRLVDWVGGK